MGYHHSVNKYLGNELNKTLNKPEDTIQIVLYKVVGFFVCLSSHLRDSSTDLTKF